MTQPTGAKSPGWAAGTLSHSRPTADGWPLVAVTRSQLPSGIWKVVVSLSRSLAKARYLTAVGFSPDGNVIGARNFRGDVYLWRCADVRGNCGCGGETTRGDRGTMTPSSEEALFAGRGTFYFSDRRPSQANRKTSQAGERVAPRNAPKSRAIKNPAVRWLTLTPGFSISIW